MSISPADQHILWTRAANRCSFRDPFTNQTCPAHLVDDVKPPEGPTILGEMAHIEGENPTSARFRASMSPVERDAYENRMLMCRPHHKTIDDQKNTYTLERLKAMKTAHEDWVRRALRPQEWNVTPVERYVSEEVYSSLLPVERAPQRIFAAPSNVGEAELKKRVGKQFLPAFIIRDGRLYTFWDLRKQPAYLRTLLKMRSLEVIQVRTWRGHEEKERYYAELLDRCLNKITGHRDLTLDKRHARYYFAARKKGEPREIQYLSVGGKATTRHVVWNPITKKTGLPKKYWVHLAVRLKFHEVCKGSWVLAIRPELHFTKDSETPLESDLVGRKSTSRKSRMWNYDVLQAVQLWREYLGEGKPRIILSMNGQSLVVSCNLLHTTIAWPGIPGDVKKFRTAEIDEDLWSVAGLDAVLREENDGRVDFPDEDEEDEVAYDGPKA